MSWAFDVTVPPGPKLVLLALADRANSDTGLCIPGQKLLAKHCSMSVRTVQRHLQTLEEAGLIRRETRMRGEGRGRTSDRYYLSDQGDKTGPMRQNTTTNATIQDDQHDAIGVAEPEGNQKGTFRKQQNTSMTESWQPKADNWQAIISRHSDLDCQTELDNFRDHWIGKGERRADWNASLRTWMRNADKWKRVNPADPPKNKPANVGPNGRTFCDICHAPWAGHDPLYCEIRASE
jgi:DNA-binding transcriptional ArsR family regulator